MLNWREIDNSGIRQPYITGRPTERDCLEFLESDAPVLSLNAAIGWSGELGYLREIASLCGKGLHLLPLQYKLDVAQLEDLASISHLYLGAGCVGRFVAARHLDLRSLYIQTEPKSTNISLEGSRIELLSCNGRDLRNPDVLGELPALSSLKIGSPSFDPGVLPSLTNVSEVDFSRWTKLANFHFLSSWPVRSIRLVSCRKVVDYGSLAGVARLESLFLDDCASIPSVESILELANLKSLVMQGAEFVDKDISRLRMSGLRSLRLSGSRYSPPAEEVMRQINDRHGL